METKIDRIFTVVLPPGAAGARFTRWAKAGGWRLEDKGAPGQFKFHAVRSYARFTFDWTVFITVTAVAVFLGWLGERRTGNSSIAWVLPLGMAGTYLVGQWFERRFWRAAGVIIEAMPAGDGRTSLRFASPDDFPELRADLARLEKALTEPGD